MLTVFEKSDFPRPNFIRTEYTVLNGKWEFDFDDSNAIKSGFINNGNIVLNKTINVPFPYQSPESGINTDEVHENVVYRRYFDISKETSSRTVLLHFGAVDHKASVYVNGRFAGEHSGGYTHFHFDITSLVKPGSNELTVFAEDPDSPSRCRGKQIWKEQPSGCHYVAVTGIWQDVWLEFTDGAYIKDIKLTSDFDSLTETALITFNKKVSGTLDAELKKDGKDFCKITLTVSGSSCLVSFHFEDFSFRDSRLINWSPDHPNLFDVSFRLETDCGTDTVESYFGFRKFEAKNGRLYLNNSQYYLKMILDQGYWTEGIYRPKDNDGYKTDVEKTKELGFNGARKHQKIEDPRYYYWADRLGLIVWGELPSFYSFDEMSMEDALTTIKEFITGFRNFPSIVTWVIFNETWGLRKLLGDSRQADFARSLYYLCKSFDPSRPVSTNDGWENINPTDIITVHDYRTLTDELIDYYNDISFLKNGSGRTGHPYMLPGEEYMGQPIMLTEFGGKRSGNSSGWGYEESELIGKSFKDIVKEDIKNAEKLKLFSGYCYTQLTDVYQETNGLLSPERQEN